MEDMPEATRRIKKMFGFEPTSNDVFIEFAPNSHAFVTALMSDRYDRIMAETCDRPLRVLTSTDEFYSITRQLNRYIASNTPRLVVETVNAEPLETFSDRVVEHVRNSKHKYDFIYLSNISYLQRTLVPDIKGFVSNVRDVLDNHLQNPDAIVIMDIFNSFGAFDINLVDVDCIAVMGILKHMCCGPNLSIGVVPKKYGNLRPLITGWRADPSVLPAVSPGMSIGDPVPFIPGLNMYGSTPAFNYGIITFNHVSAAWEACGVTVAKIHQHVLSIHHRFIDGLKKLKAEGRENPYICIDRYLYQPEATRSHTLVFVQENPSESKVVVEYLSSHSIAIDNRKTYLRLGIGFNHNPEDIDNLLDVLSKYNQKV